MEARIRELERQLEDCLNSRKRSTPVDLEGIAGKNIVSSSRKRVKVKRFSQDLSMVSKQLIENEWIKLKRTMFEIIMRDIRGLNGVVLKKPELVKDYIDQNEKGAILRIFGVNLKKLTKEKAVEKLTALVKAILLLSQGKIKNIHELADSIYSGIVWKRGDIRASLDEENSWEKYDGTAWKKLSLKF
jgi:hypothetical protein